MRCAVNQTSEHFYVYSMTKHTSYNPLVIFMFYCVLKWAVANNLLKATILWRDIKRLLILTKNCNMDTISKNVVIYSLKALSEAWRLWLWRCNWPTIVFIASCSLFTFLQMYLGFKITNIVFICKDYLDRQNVWIHWSRRPVRAGLKRYVISAPVYLQSVL